MTRDEFRAFLDANGYAYELRDDGGVTITHLGHVNLRSLTTLPAGTVFKNSGDVYLDRLTTLPAGTVFKNSGSVYLYSLTTLPDGAVFNNSGSVNLRSLTTLPDGTVFKNGGNVYLHSLTTLPDGTVFKNGGNVYLHSLTTLPDGTVFKNSGYVNLRSLTTLPDGTVFKNSGSVYLRSLTTLPDGTAFNNSGDVHLGSLSGHHTYQGKRRLFMNIDGWTMIITASRNVGGTTIHRAKYLRGGPVDDLPQCWIAERDGLFAHGETPKEALDDLSFKILNNASKEKIAAAIVASGEVTLDQWRALTTACTEGTRQHLSSLGIDLDSLDKMPLADALKAMKGTTFGDTFKKHLEATKA